MSLFRASSSTELPTSESMTLPRVREGLWGGRYGEEGVGRKGLYDLSFHNDLCVLLVAFPTSELT